VEIIGDLLHGRWGAAFDAAKAAVASLLSKVKSVLAAIPGAFTHALGAIGRAALSVGSAILDKIMGGIGDIGGKLVSLIKNAVNAVIRRVNSILTFRVSVDTHIPGLGKVGFGNTMNLPTLATGGIVNRPTLAVIGERGPEAVVPLHRGGFGGVTVNFHHTPADADPQAIAAAIAWKTRRLAG
jgi:phage-related minor tail protein